MQIKKFLPILLIISPSCYLNTGCMNENEIIFANFESYMSINLIRQYQNEAQFIYYGTNEEIQTKFKQNYDVAIPTTYEAIDLLSQNLLEKIDWSLFNLTNENSELITNGHEAEVLFTDEINNIMNSMTEYCKEKMPEYFSNNETLYDYCIPYFLQSFIFAYKGCRAIDELDNCTNWNDYITQMTKNKYFDPTKTSHIGMVDDSRTIYDLAHIMLTENNTNKPYINPDNENQSISEYRKDHQAFTKYFYGKNNFYFNTDSQEILNSLSNPSGNHSSFAYNGDILYAAMGAGLYDSWNENNFHISNIKDSVLALDVVVLNKKLDKKLTHKQKVYNIVNKICLNGCDKGERISDTKENDDYVYGIMENFDYVNYTAVFKNIDDYVLNGDYFSEEEYAPEEINLYKKIYKIVADNDDISRLIELPISNLAKSNMHWAYNEEKEKI